MADPSPAAAQPRFSLSLTPTADVCHLNGEPRFGLNLKILSHEDEIITICLHKTPLKEIHGLEEIVYVTNEEGEEVEWPYGIGCWEYDEPFPDDFCFEEFKSGVPYERTFWLDKEDPATAQGGELGSLETGKEYKVQLSEDLLGAFSKWRRGRKEELLAGGLEEKKERWKGGSGKISLDVSDPFTFKAT
ncbi:uncharacterized protein N0V89_005369 [Didymosphaeria variabile]|uniref:Uncharacterized protein n=1 Tax=Didymosphaeria variabile TaxID=1932322 RepID=A0A9W8XLH7_9PLEO|nr:uncharacterized protein N0V89_005369 [Didymosphaeria variabile]KAJ4353639.1 hypothetical protein N0V89_005369 [Didymosphaeria variabile]